jgi:dihydrodipicolinate synthase/N-acetylneuraminate lyase
MPALVTPFSRAGEIDLEAHTSNLRTLSDAGIEGFVIGGSTGEGPYLEPGDRQRLVRAGRRRKAYFMVGIAAESTRLALAQLREASDGGADAVLVMTPTTLSRGRDEAVLRFYRTVADASPLPVFLYSVPGVTAYNLPVEAVAKLARHDRIVGIKDSSGDVVRMQSIIDAAPPEFLVYTGSSRALTAAIAIGCHGAITASGNYVSDLVLRTMAAAGESPSRARRLQKQLSAISADVEAHGIPGIKAAAKAAGLDPGHPREPLIRLSQGAETSIAKLI